MATFILVHGAWHGGWCFERVVPLLVDRGYHVLAPDLPGMGEDRTSLTDVTLDSWAKFVADLVRQQDEKVILLGHSRGGIVISQAAEYVAEHIQSLVYLAAFLIPNGETLWGTIKQHPRGTDRLPDLVLSSDKSTSTVANDAIRDTFYNTTSDEWQRRAAARIGPEPMANFLTPLILTDANFGQVPRTYIECLEDRAIPIALQRSMVSRLPCQRVITLDSDHSPFYSEPVALTSHLIELATK